MRTRPSTRKESRRPGRCVPGLDFLEVRYLLSHFLDLVPPAFVRAQRVEVVPVADRSRTGDLAAGPVEERRPVTPLPDTPRLIVGLRGDRPPGPFAGLPPS